MNRRDHIKGPKLLSTFFFDDDHDGQCSVHAMLHSQDELGKTWSYGTGFSAVKIHRGLKTTDTMAAAPHLKTTGQ